MKKYILFLFSFMMAHSANAMNTHHAYTADIKFSNNSQADIEIALRGIGNVISLKTNTSTINPISVDGTEQGIFITEVIAYDKTGDKHIYPENNVVVKKLNWNIGYNAINCKEPENRTTYSLIFNNAVIEALVEAESVAQRGILPNAIRAGLVTVTDEGIYKLKKTSYSFYDYDYKSTSKIISIRNDASKSIIVKLNEDSSLGLLIKPGKSGGINVSHDFILKALEIDGFPLANDEVINAAQAKINWIIPHHSCVVLAIDDDLLRTMGVPAIGHYVTFVNKSRMELVIDINNIPANEIEIILAGPPGMKRQDTQKKLENIRQGYQAEPSSSTAAPSSPRIGDANATNLRQERITRVREMNKRSQTVDLRLHNHRYIQSISINGQVFEIGSPLVDDLNKQIAKGVDLIINLDNEFFKKYNVTVSKQ